MRESKYHIGADDEIPASDTDRISYGAEYVRRISIDKVYSVSLGQQTVRGNSISEHNQQQTCISFNVRSQQLTYKPAIK